MSVIARVELSTPCRIALGVPRLVAWIVECRDELVLRAHQGAGRTLCEVEVEPSQLPSVVIEIPGTRKYIGLPVTLKSNITEE